jgi:two-component system nitrogen regulation sensor histidine kinase NtrY
LAQMPPPVFGRCSITELARRASALESRVKVTVVPGPELMLEADSDQLEQMLINLLRNAAESVLEAPLSKGGSNGSAEAADCDMPIVLTWMPIEKGVALTIEDCGAGLMNPGNAFVPFYTTKPQGSGIGLILSRQICEAHGGSLELSNRHGKRGCVAKVVLPIVSVNRNTLARKL